MYRVSSIKYVFLSNFQVSWSIEPESQKALVCIRKEYLSVRWIKSQEEGSEETVYSLFFSNVFHVYISNLKWNLDPWYELPYLILITPPLPYCHWHRILSSACFSPILCLEYQESCIYRHSKKRSNSNSLYSWPKIQLHFCWSGLLLFVLGYVTWYSIEVSHQPYIWRKLLLKLRS